MSGPTMFRMPAYDPVAIAVMGCGILLAACGVAASRAPRCIGCAKLTNGFSLAMVSLPTELTASRASLPTILWCKTSSRSCAPAVGGP